MNFIELSDLEGLDRSGVFWDGCRVVAFDNNDEMYKYGVVWNYDEHSPFLNLVLDGEPVKTIRVTRNRAYKTEDWTERKPTKSLGKVNLDQFRSAEKAPPPPKYFTRRLPINADLTFARAAWIWAEAHVFKKFAGKTMDIPKFIHTNFSTGMGRADGVWYLKERVMGIRKNGNLTYLKYFTTIVHEMCHQYNSVVQRLVNEGHGPNFQELIEHCGPLCGVQIPALYANANDDLVQMGDDKKIKSKENTDIDLTTKSKLKFFVIAIHTEGVYRRLMGVRAGKDVMKGIEQVTQLNTMGYAAALYDAPFAALEVLNSAAGTGTKFFNSLRPLTGSHIQLLAEHSTLASETTVDVVKRYIKYNPDYLNNV